MTDDVLQESLQREIDELRGPRKVSLYDHAGNLILTAVFNGDQDFVWTAAAGLTLHDVAAIEVRR